MASRSILATDRDFFTWQFENALDKDHLSFLVAQDPEDLVGIMGVIELPYGVYGKSCSGYSCSIIKSRADYSKCGLRLKMMDFLSFFKCFNNFGMTKKANALPKIKGYYVEDEFPRLIAASSLTNLSCYLALSGYSEESRKIICTTISSINFTQCP